LICGKTESQRSTAGKVGTMGTSPNGQEFIANPLCVWVIDESSARPGDDDFGPTGPPVEETRLGDFWVVQRGVFAIGRASFLGQQTDQG
jgi:hypothetical protein